jgi:3-oxoacyl-[acyl-carrier-protein] synthase-1
VRALGSVVGWGAITPVGLHAVDSALSHRAAAAAMREAPLVDLEGAPITMCFLPVLDPRLVGRDRALALGSRALDEALGSLGLAARGLRARLAVSVSEHLVGDAPDLEAQRIGADLAAVASRHVAVTAIDANARGPAGPGHLLGPLCEALASGAADAVILGGVHTDYDPARIAALDSAGRLFRPDNLDALIPGEAAAFVVLMRGDVAHRYRLRKALEIHAVATAFERARPDNDEPAFQATGLTAAIRSATAPLAQEGLRAGWLLTDLTFETFRHFELQAASTRTQRHFCEPQQVDSPAQRMGHLGAAAAPLHLAIAAEAFRRGFAPHPYALSIAGSDGGERAAVLLSHAGA